MNQDNQSKRGAIVRWCEDGNDCIYDNCPFRHEKCKFIDTKHGCGIENPMLKPGEGGCLGDHRDRTTLHKYVRNVPMGQTSDIIKLFGDKGIVKHPSKEIYFLNGMEKVNRKLLTRSLKDGKFDFVIIEAVDAETNENPEKHLIIYSAPNEPKITAVQMKHYTDACRFHPTMENVGNDDNDFDITDLSDTEFRTLTRSLIEGGFTFGFDDYNGLYGKRFIVHLTDIPGRRAFSNEITSQQEMIKCCEDHKTTTEQLEDGSIKIVRMPESHFCHMRDRLKHGGCKLLDYSINYVNDSEGQWYANAKLLIRFPN